MVNSGDVLEHPVTGERIVFRKTARDTDGALMQADFLMASGGFVAAAHIHPLQEERFEVIAGTLHGRIAGRELTAGPGEVVVVRRMSGGTPATPRCACLWKPALRFGSKTFLRPSSAWHRTAR